MRKTFKEMKKVYEARRLRIFNQWDEKTSYNDIAKKEHLTPARIGQIIKSVRKQQEKEKINHGVKNYPKSIK